MNIDSDYLLFYNILFFNFTDGDRICRLRYNYDYD